VTRGDGVPPPDRAAAGRPQADSEAERAVASAEGPAEVDAAPPPPRRSAFLARNPVFAGVALVACGWLVWDMAPDVAYFFSPRDPIDLGAPGAYRLDAARANRLVRIQGAVAAQVPVTTSRGEARRVVGLAGTSVAVDRPASGGPSGADEGRLLPRREARAYDAAVAALREGGFAAPGEVAVVRDGERPGQRWSRPILSLVALLLGALNLRALALHLVH